MFINCRLRGIAAKCEVQVPIEPIGKYLFKSTISEKLYMFIKKRTVDI
jgi:hypothetical protein